MSFGSVDSTLEWKISYTLPWFLWPWSGFRKFDLSNYVYTTEWFLCWFLKSLQVLVWFLGTLCRHWPARIYKNLFCEYFKDSVSALNICTWQKVAQESIVTFLFHKTHYLTLSPLHKTSRPTGCTPGPKDLPVGCPMANWSPFKSERLKKKRWSLLCNNAWP
jgi:hypothetical protein